MVLARPELRIRKGLRHPLLDFLESHAHRVSPSRLMRATSDPGNNLFLECADETSADYLVTGNQRHFPKFWKATKIVSSREFIALVAPHLMP